MPENVFFERKGPFPLKEILNTIGYNGEFKNLDNLKIYGFESLNNACEKDMTFLNSSKYQNISLKTNAAVCITTPNLSKFLPEKCIKLNVKNVLFEVTKASKMFFPTADIDYPDKNLSSSSELLKLYPKVYFGKNVLIGKNVKIGKNCLKGHNSILESNIVIGNNCSIGSNVIIRNTILKDNVNILDGCVIGKKGFGFFPNKNKNFKYPHIGIVIIDENSEIGCGSTIDRGSMSNTIIGKNTYLDNQIHIAHNNKIGNNCIIAGQVGFAGSSTLGNNVMIGGQAGISGHLKIGNNVQIGGGSGVIKSIPDNSKVMGYPAKDLKKFIKDNK